MRPFIFVVLALLLGADSLFAQQLKTGDGQYVAAIVEPLTGLITIRKYPGTNLNPILSFPQKSFLYVMVGDRIFTNNNIGVNVTSDPRYGGFLSNGVNQKVADTIRTTWTNKNGCDIIQEVYPVKLAASAQIVIRWKVKNNSNTPLWGQAQFLLDVQTGAQNPNDGTPILTRYGYRPIWEQYTSASTYGIPWFFASFEFMLPNPPSFSPGVSGVGYTQDANYKLGLKRPTTMTVGDWGAPLGNALVDNLWGVSVNTPWGTSFADAAILFQWDGSGIAAGKTTEIARTSYGTGEFGICPDEMLSLVFYPPHFDWKGSKYQPDTGYVDLYAFNIHSPIPQDPNYGPPSSNVSLTLHAGPNLRIVSPDTGNLLQKEQRQQLGPAAGYIPQYGVGTAFWEIVADNATGCTNVLDSWLLFTGDGTYSANKYLIDSCTLPLKIDCVQSDYRRPIADNLKETQVFPKTKTFDVYDNRVADSGLDTITWVVSPGSSTDTSKFKIEPPTFPPCSKSKYTVKITQLDSTAGGCFDFTISDCAGNDTLYTVCIPAVIIENIPDTLSPVITVTRKIVGGGAIPPCDGLCDSILITEIRPYDVGLDSIIVINSVNMQMFSATIPQGAPTYRALLCVIDSLRDGQITIRAIDTVGNYNDTTFCYDVVEGSVRSTAAGNDLELIGNPASKQTVLRIKLATSQTVNVSILDMTGRTLQTRPLGMIPSGITDIPIATTDLAGGTYYIVAEWNGMQFAKKLSVVK